MPVSYAVIDVIPYCIANLVGGRERSQGRGGAASKLSADSRCVAISMAG